MDVLCSRTGGLANIKGDVLAIVKSVHAVENETDTGSSLVSSLNDHLDEIRPVDEHRASEVRKVEKEKRLAELKEQEERRKGEEAARLKEEQEEKGDVGDVLSLCSRKELET